MFRRRMLGRTGFEVSEISLGAGQIASTGHGRISRQQAFSVLRAFEEGGGNFIDTARGYGESERYIGEYFRANGYPEDLVIASKTWETDPLEIRRELEESLRLLGRDRIDLYYMHEPPAHPAEMDRVLDTYEHFRDEGKIRAIGASIKGPEVTPQTVELCRQTVQTGRVDVLMVVYSIFRQANAAMLAEASGESVGIVARTVLEDGFLTGRYVPGDSFKRPDDPRGRWGNRRLAAILECAQELKQWAVVPPYETLAQVAIRFALDRNGISNVVLGARTEAQMRACIETAALPPLAPEIRERLVAAFHDRDDEFNTG